MNSQNLPSASIVPGIDAVEEFRAVTQLAPASDSSSSTVNVAIKSGTNDFHGALYEFFRNNVLDAHPFFERQISTPSFHTIPDQLRSNQFGGALGGPIQRNRTFFFTNLEFTRQRTLSQVTGIYPTAQMLQGDFSGVNPLSGTAMSTFAPVIDPQTGKPFPGNQVPAVRFSAFASKFLPIAFIPANCPECQAEGLGFNFAGEAHGHVDNSQYLGRMDRYISQADTLSGTFSIQPGFAVTGPSPIPISVIDTPTRAYFAAIDETHTFNPSTINQARLGYTRLRATLQQE